WNLARQLFGSVSWRTLTRPQRRRYFPGNYVQERNEGWKNDQFPDFGAMGKIARPHVARGTGNPICYLDGSGAPTGTAQSCLGCRWGGLTATRSCLGEESCGWGVGRAAGEQDEAARSGPPTTMSKRWPGCPCGGFCDTGAVGS